MLKEMKRKGSGPSMSRSPETVTKREKAEGAGAAQTIPLARSAPSSINANHFRKIIMMNSCEDEVNACSTPRRTRRGLVPDS